MPRKPSSVSGVVRRGNSVVVDRECTPVNVSDDDDSGSRSEGEVEAPAPKKSRTMTSRKVAKEEDLCKCIECNARLRGESILQDQEATIHQQEVLLEHYRQLADALRIRMDRLEENVKGQGKGQGKGKRPNDSNEY